MMRTLAVFGALLAFAAVVALDSPTPGGQDAATQTTTSAPRTVQSVCPGPQTIPVGDIESGDVTLDSGSTDVRLEVLPAGSDVVDDGRAFDTVGIAVERIGTGDIAGLAGLTCAPAAHDQWLVGGATVPGSSARLVLSNPAATSVSAAVTLYTPVGEADAQATVVIGPGAQRVVLLEALEPEMPGLAINVSAGGAGVSAALQDSRLEGFTAAGSDWVGASALGTELGIPVPSTTDDNAEARLAMLAPHGADVTLRMVTESGEVPWRGEQTHTLAPGTLVEIPMPNADAGVVLIDSSAPIAAAAATRVARTAPTGDDARAYDLAWTAAQERADERTRATVIPADSVITDGDVELVAYANEPGTYRLDADGQVVDVVIREGTAVRMPVDLAQGTVLSSDDALTWALIVTDEPGFLTTLEPVSVEEITIDTTTRVGGYLP